MSTARMSCKGKKPYNGKRAANDALEKYRREVVGGIRINAHVYKCGDHYHWGHFRRRKL